MELKYTVTNSDKSKTINEILSSQLNFSTRLCSKLIKNKNIYKNVEYVDSRNHATLGDTIVIDFNYKEDNSNITPTNMDLNIIYEDEWLLVVNKPAGIPVHPSRLHYENSLSNGIKYYFDTINLKKKIRPVNRLDLDTSGLVIFAKCEYIQESFINQMANHIFNKEYLCIIESNLDKKEGLIDFPIARKEGSIIERCIDKKGQKSITHYHVMKEFKDYSFVQCRLETGRTHQIRVHMQAIGHPIIGDTLYGKKSPFINRQALHSYKINCIHPVSKKELNFIAKLPKDMEVLLK